MKQELLNWKKTTGKEIDRCTLANKRIKSIGNPLPDFTNRITKLYLSNNELRSLSGIENFPNLSHLSISNNKILDFSELTKLTMPSALQSLSIQGNFFAKNPRAYEDIINYFIKCKNN